VRLEAAPEVATAPVGQVAQCLESGLDEAEEGEAGEDDEGGAHGSS
jgi:hypothetical protein